MERKILFITKSLCYHQVGIADELYSIFGDSFAFIQMREPLEFRVLNNQEGFERPYLFGYQKNTDSHFECDRLIQKADVIIWGEASLRIIKQARKDAILLKYSERIFKSGFYKTNLLHFVVNCINLLRLKFFMRRRQCYLLSAGYYSSIDYKKFGLFKSNSLKWGYFPRLEEYMDNHNYDQKLKIIWANRLLKWKHPEYLIFAANFFKKTGIPYEINVVGDGDKKSGEMKPKILKKIDKNNLSNNVHMLGKLKPLEVLDLYKRSDIALFTSGPAEGWGVGLNEAMNFGCICLASDKMGSTRYLIDNGINGFVYKFGSKKSFETTLSHIVSQSKKFPEISKRAKQTIQNNWNYKLASKKLAKVLQNLMEQKKLGPLPNNGPCSLVEE